MRRPMPHRSHAPSEGSQIPPAGSYHVIDVAVADETMPATGANTGAPIGTGMSSAG
jgi:hypothetical protein